MKIITVYSKRFCPFCTRAHEFLKNKAKTIKFEVKSILVEPENIELLEEMVKKSGGKKTFPQIFVDNISIGGYDDLIALDKANKFNSLFV